MAGYNPRTLPGLTYQLANKLLGPNQMLHGTATGGTSSTIIDTVALVQENDYWNGGTAWLLSGGISADEGGQAARVADFTNSTATLSLTDAITAPSANALYAVADARYPLLTLLAAINEAIADIGDIVYTRTGDYTSASSQTEYTLVRQTDAGDIPVVLDADAKVLNVWYQSKANDANDNKWIELTGWSIQKSNPGSMNVLIFDEQPPAPFALKITFAGRHPLLFQYGAMFWTELDQSVPYQLVVARAAYNLLLKELGGDIQHPRLLQQMREIQAYTQKTETEHAPAKEFPRPQLLNVPNSRYVRYDNDLVHTP